VYRFSKAGCKNKSSFFITKSFLKKIFSIFYKTNNTKGFDEHIFFIAIKQLRG